MDTEDQLYEMAIDKPEELFRLLESGPGDFKLSHLASAAAFLKDSVRAVRCLAAILGGSPGASVRAGCAEGLGGHVGRSGMAALILSEMAEKDENPMVRRIAGCELDI